MGLTALQVQQLLYLFVHLLQTKVIYTFTTTDRSAQTALRHLLQGQFQAADETQSYTCVASCTRFVVNKGFGVGFESVSSATSAVHKGNANQSNFWPSN